MDVAGGLVDRGGLDGGDLLLAQALADDVEPAGQGGIAESAVPLAGELGSDGGAERFLWIMSSPWALARAAAIAPMVSLERCIGRLHVH
jgi:hypothetical protein